MGSTRDGTPVVVHAAFTGDFYADRVVMDPGGARAYVVDPNTTANAGGIYQLSIACDGGLGDEGLLLQASSPGALIVAGTVGQAQPILRSPWLLQAGEIEANFSADPTGAGAISWTVTYVPYDDAATLVAS
jgi:hypothetical protein